MSDFTHIQEPYGDRWLNSDGLHFVSYYEAIDGVRAAYWQAYRAAQKPARGRMPWTVDNRRIGRDGYGYSTLDAAMQACVAGVILKARRA